MKALDGFRRHAFVTNRLVVPCVVALLAAALSHLHFDDYQIAFSYSDLLPRWAGTRLALQGIDPYNYQILSGIQSSYHVTPQPFLYPAHVVLYLLPLAPLTLLAAQIVFLVVITPLFAWSLWLTMQISGLPASGRMRVWVLLLACVSWPVMWSLRLQQLTLLVAAIIFIAWGLIVKGRQALPGILLALATIKPQLILPLLLWLLVWAVLRRQWLLLGSFAGTLGILYAGTSVIVPGWWPHWLASVHNYSDVRHTAPPLPTMFGHRIGLALTAAVVLVAALALLRLLRCRARSPQFVLVLSLALAVTLCMVSAAQTMIYNYTLLFPAILVLIFARPHDYLANAFRFFALLLLAWDFATVPIAAIAELLLGPSSFWNAFPFMDFILPVLITLALSIEILRRPGQLFLTGPDTAAMTQA